MGLFSDTEYSPPNHRERYKHAIRVEWFDFKRQARGSQIFVDGALLPPRRIIEMMLERVRRTESQNGIRLEPDEIRIGMLDSDANDYHVYHPKQGEWRSGSFRRHGDVLEPPCAKPEPEDTGRCVEIF